MAKAFRGEAVVHLPRASNKKGHASLRLAHRVEWFDLFSSGWAQPIVPWLTKTIENHRDLSDMQW